MFNVKEPDLPVNPAAGTAFRRFPVLLKYSTLRHDTQPLLWLTEWILIPVLVFLFALPVQAGIRHIAVPYRASPESLNVWIFFTDKPEAMSSGSGKTATASYPSGTLWSDATGQPVSSVYIRRVQSCGGVLRHIFKWDNTASFRIPVAAVKNVRSLSCVKKVTMVARRRIVSRSDSRGVGKTVNGGNAGYGNALNQLSMLRIPEAHRYLSFIHPHAAPGEGVRIAFFDSGFRLDHRCFRHLHQRGALTACHDFIDQDTSVADPDSVKDNQKHPLWSNDHHGTEVLSTVAALDTPWYCGAAWGAQFLLARTEDAFYDSTTGLEHELHTEEDNWAAAVVWAESLGVDIISSSLGYWYDFQDTVVVEREEGENDTIVNYLKSDMNGKTTIVSRAAGYAVERGIIVVNAAGNERIKGDTSLSAPADVDGVIAVGAVNANGTLAYFSSLGPSADGRIKPDLVAPGTSIYLPDVLNPATIDYSRTSSGTSYAAPLVTGICALLRQAHPQMEADRLREYLYNYCRLLPGQIAPDNTYGRGLPDAVRSCMSDVKEVFLVAVDTGGVPLKGVTVTDGVGDSIGVTSDAGFFSYSGDSMTIEIRFRAQEKERRISVSSLPFFREVFPCSLLVRVVDKDSNIVKGVTASVRSGSDSWGVAGDSLGTVTVAHFFPVSVTVVISGAGFRQTDTICADLSDTTLERTIVMHTSKRPLFEVYPTVVRKSRGERLRIRFAPEVGVLQQRIKACIRSLNGNAIWQTSLITDGRPVDLLWSVRTTGGGRIAPGTYFLLLSCDDRQYRKKFIIAE